MSWGSKRIAGVDYDLTHLDGFDMDVEAKHAPAQQFYKVRVRFGAHTFTRDLLDSDTPDFHFLDGGVWRCFCPIRHSCSTHLPRIVQAAANGRAFFGNKHEKFLLVENLDGLNAPYVIAFTMTQSKAPGVDAAMFVVSAHDRPGLPKNLPVIHFTTLVSLTVQGKNIIRPRTKK
jgi:hypothetical protein